MKIFLLNLLLCSVSTFAANNSLIVILPNKEVKYSLRDLKTKLKIIQVSIDDPVYKKQKSYEGFYFNDLLQLAGLDFSSAGEELVFTAVDGYSPNTSFANLKKYKGVLVFKESGKKDFEFEKVAQGKTMITMAPYYLVWEGGARAVEGVPWPYQLVKIEVVNFQQKFPKVFPKEAKSDSNAMKGFVVFKDQCIRCHSINLEGGDLGPELNAPQNVTEYWSKNILKKFIHNAPSFRYKSKMPSFTHLKEEEIDRVIAYLEHMKKYKSKE